MLSHVLRTPGIAATVMVPPFAETGGEVALSGNLSGVTTRLLDRARRYGTPESFS
jgi:hypothetical protein